MASDVRNLLSTVKERRNVDEIGSGGRGRGGGGRKGKLSEATVHDRLIGTKIDTTILACANGAEGAPVELVCCAKLAHGRDTTGTIDKKLISGVSIGR